MSGRAHSVEKGSLVAHAGSLKFLRLRLPCSQELAKRLDKEADQMAAGPPSASYANRVSARSLPNSFSCAHIAPT